jgi:nucleotide-binding universal stress UspA family protein
MTARSVVVGLDESPLAEAAFQVALEQAGGGTLHVVQVASGFDPLHQLEYAAEQQRLDLGPDQKRLEARVGQLLARRVDPASATIVRHVQVGPAAKGIARVARSVDADLVVVGTHGRAGMERLLLGSVAERVLREVGCSVLVVRQKSWQ